MNDEEEIVDLQLSTLKKIDDIKISKDKLQDFIKHYDKTVSSKEDIVPRQAKSGEKALKLLFL